MNDPHLARFPVLEPGRLKQSCAAGQSIARRRAFPPPHIGLRARLRAEHGAATAEYAITTLAAVGFAGLLVVVLRSGEVRSMLTDIIRSALSISS
jgi:Flp pilus assembly pilin Flp